MKKLLLPAFVSLALLHGPAHGVMIVMDYSNDTFFAGNTAARNALEAAAADLGAALTTTLAAVDADVFTGVNGSTSATFDWLYTYPNPTTGATVTIEVPRAAANEVRIFAGARKLTGSTLGIGQAVGWETNVSGTNWLGAQTIAQNGTGTGIIAPDGAHPKDNLTSLLLNGLTSQEVVMSPSLTNGERRLLTQLDLALMRDIGWDTVAIPEPTTAVSMLCGMACLLARRPRRELPVH